MPPSGHKLSLMSTLIEARASFNGAWGLSEDGPTLRIMLQAAPVGYLNRGAIRCVTIVCTP